MMGCLKKYVLEAIFLALCVLTANGHPHSMCQPEGELPKKPGNFAVPRDSIPQTTFLSEVAGVVWRNAYIMFFKETETFPPANVTELRFLYTGNDTAIQTHATYRPDPAASCDSTTSNVYIWGTHVHNTNRTFYNEAGSQVQTRFYTRCLSKYIWQWTCFDRSTIWKQRCRSEGYLALNLRGSDADTFPIQLAMLDLKRNSRQSFNEHYIPTQRANSCPDPTA